MNRRRFLAGLLATAASTGIYTWHWEPHWVEFVHRDLPISGLPAALLNNRLVQLSDLHIGSSVDDAYLLGAFKSVRQMAPEIVVYTGDLTSSTNILPPNSEAIISQFPLGKDGTFATLGNHDYGINWSKPRIADALASAIRDRGVTVLRNSVAEVRGLQIGGLDDIWAGRFRPYQLFSVLHPRQPALILSHNPDTVDEPGWASYSGWILAGHTHGGQCKPPFLPPPLLPVKNRRYTAGEFSVSGGRRLYINRGLGHLLKVRFNVRPEITVFRLIRPAGEL